MARPAQDSWILAAIGLYDLVTYNVTRRRREIGIRMALGPVQLVKSLLFGITPRDPLTFVTALSSLIVITILASLLPAARAARVDPMLALRAE